MTAVTTARAGLATGARDPRLDFFRGLCLVMIYVNHIPGTVFEHLTSRNFGLSDAAEGFVFMSGCAVALSYGPRVADGLKMPHLLRGWGRSWQLYLVHLMTSIWAISIVAGATVLLGADEVFKTNSFNLLREQPFQVIFGVAALTHQFGYVNILPMYAVLMLFAPVLVRLGQLRPGLLLALSVIVWAIVAEFRIDLPNYPQQGGWFFNPFAWQILFCIGILTGLALRRGERLVPVKGWIVALTLGWVLFCLVWAQSAAMTRMMNEALLMLNHWGVPYFIAGFDKTYVSLPRLSHFLALAYVVSLPVIFPRLAAAKFTAPIRLIGRHSLPIFAAGTVLAIFAQGVKDVHPAGFGQDAVLVLGGLGVLWGFAYLLDRARQAEKRL